MVPPVIQVLEYIEENGSDAYKRHQANGLLEYFQSFSYVVFLYMDW